MATQCAFCGAKTELEELFYKKVVCPPCMAKRFAASGKLRLFRVVAMGAFAIWLVYFSPNDSFGWVCVNFVLYEVVGMLCTIPHELAHAGAAKLVGWRPFYIIIGVGKIIYQKDCFGINVVFKMFPGGGLAFAAPAKGGYKRIHHAFVIAAGPASNLLLAMFSAWWIIRGWQNADFEQQDTGFFAPILTRVALPQVILISNLIILIRSLYPRQFVNEAGHCRTDGLTLLDLPKKSPADIENLYVAHYLYSLEHLIRQKNTQKLKSNANLPCVTFRAMAGS